MMDVTRITLIVYAPTVDVEQVLESFDNWFYGNDVGMFREAPTTDKQVPADVQEDFDADEELIEASETAEPPKENLATP